jgi:hypothetical protein
LFWPDVARTEGVNRTVAASSKDVYFTINGNKTYGTLDVPTHRANQHLAAALLLAGSGPTDRNGNQQPSLTPNTLGQIAAALDKMGIMRLRFDKYFAGKTGAGSHASDPGSLDLTRSSGRPTPRTNCCPHNPRRTASGCS